MSGAPLGLTPAHAEDFARRALDNIAREYPNHPQYLLTSDTDALPPRVIHPCFFGAFDWHSAVHNHWLLVRLLRAEPRLEIRADIEAALTRSFEPSKTRAEAAYLERHPAFERPYGLAWLALLAAEVRSSASAAAGAWSAALQPLANACRGNVVRWLGQLRHPVRSGTHNQSAFALALLLDAAAATHDGALLEMLRATALRLYRADVDAPLSFEPSGEDFLSPCSMEADLMRRVLAPHDFGEWLAHFLPRIPTRNDGGWLACAQVADEADGKAVHLHGLNLSRAWNLANVAAALPESDARRAALLRAADRHRAAGVTATLATKHYAGNHWLPTFAVYLLTEFGAPNAAASPG
jgi:hypothetical protein